MKISYNYAVLKSGQDSMNSSRLTLAHIFFILATFTSSFDVFLIFNLGFNFRATQLLLIVSMALAIVNNFKRNPIKPLGAKWLFLWALFVIVFVPNTNYINFSIGYALWLVFNIITIFVCVNIFIAPSQVIILVRWYIYSFVFVALFGLVQFVSPVLGFGKYVLIQQWWIPGVLPRLNGFSYEPSYFATYLLMGWVICAYLIGSKSSVFNRTHLQANLAIITLALILSSSRMGIVMMIIWYFQYPLRFINRLFHCCFNKRLAKISAYLGIVLVFIVVIIVYFIGTDNLSFLLAGLGLSGQASHSVSDRTHGAEEMLTIFLKSPVIGYSLGGVNAVLAEMSGVTSGDIADIAKYTGFSVFMEVLAASGLVGFIPFIIFIWTIVVKPLRLAQKVSSHQAALLIALTLSLIFELAILQFNQNILRPYLWVHIAVLSASYSAFLRSNKPTIILQQLELP